MGRLDIITFHVYPLYSQPPNRFIIKRFLKEAVGEISNRHEQRLNGSRVSLQHWIYAFVKTAAWAQVFENFKGGDAH